jgi:aspartokinase-like uncharacterized kinase
MSVIQASVIKVGGSLFDWPELPARLSALLDGLRVKHQRAVLLAGGGRATDFVRAVDQTFALGDLPAHRLALRSLDLTAHVLATLLPDLEVIDERAGLEVVWGRKRTPVFAPRRFLEECDSDPLPCTWELTSDSIAARLAVHVGAAELVLLKSTAVPPGTDRRAAAALGLVDPLFPTASRSLERVLYANLRDDRREPLLLR